MKVSIAMATYNGAKYLKEQLDSLAGQTRLPDELVITDDCSTDDTIAVIHRFAGTAPFEVRLRLNETTLGYAGNFNKALMLATGDLVFLCDQDDVWFSTKVEAFVSAFEKDPSFFSISCDCCVTDEYLNNEGVTKLQNMKALGMTEKDYVTGCCSAFSRFYLNYVLPIPENQYEHDTFLLGLATALDRRLMIYEPLQYFRRHSNTASSGIEKSAGGVGVWVMFNYYARRILLPPKVDVRKEVITKANVRKGIDYFLKQAGISNRHQIARNSSRLDAELAFSIRRMDALSVNGANRLFKVVSLYREGGYRQYRGIVTALRDIVRA